MDCVVFCFVIQETSWLLDSDYGAQVDLPSSKHYINDYFRIVVAFVQVVQCKYMHGRTSTFTLQVIGKSIDNSRCGMSIVAFRTAPPIWWAF